MIEELKTVPETYLKDLKGTGGLYEVRVQVGNDIFRIFCFFDQGQLIILINGFQKKSQKTPKREIEKALKLKRNMSKKKNSIMTLDQFKDKHFGKVGTPERNELEEGYENFKLGALIHEARLEKGLTQAQLAEKVGTTKSYISKIENNIKEVRLSTLKNIVELGLGGQIELSIKL
ncbi:MAG: type II toxin-antitoxin system RelE/ParE family toxin [Fulvivirga sp.]